MVDFLPFDLIETYQTVVISFLPIAEQIRLHFPAEGSTESSADKKSPLPPLLTETQILHALATPPLREGIRGTALNLKLLRKIDKLQEKLQTEQRLIHKWHDELIAVHNSKETKEDYAFTIEQLANSAQKIITIQQTLQESREKLNRLILTQHVLAVAQDTKWLKHEDTFIEALFAEVTKQQIPFESELKDNLLKKRTMLDDIIAKFKVRNFPIPKELENA